MKIKMPEPETKYEIFDLIFLMLHLLYPRFKKDFALILLLPTQKGFPSAS